MIGKSYDDHDITVSYFDTRKSHYNILPIIVLMAQHGYNSYVGFQSQDSCNRYNKLFTYRQAEKDK